MDALISTFHLDGKLLLAQVVNFLIVFIVLYYGALKPLMKVMRERTSRIDQSLRDADAIEKRLGETDKKTRTMVETAQREAQKLLEEAKSQAEHKRQEMMQKAKIEIEKLVQHGKDTMAQEQERMIDEARAEVGKLVVRAAEKLLGGELPKKMDSDLIKKTIDEL